MVEGFDKNAFTRSGTINGEPVSVRILIYNIDGHKLHHIKIVEERYLTYWKNALLINERDKLLKLKRMTKEFATAFARDWVGAWNAHDLEKILLHYSEDFIIETPMALKLYPQSYGIVVGKSEVRKYWTIGLAKSPNLRFEILDVLVGVNSLGLYLFNTSSNKKSVELMSFNIETKVSKVIVIHSE